MSMRGIILMTLKCYFANYFDSDSFSSFLIFFQILRSRQTTCVHVVHLSIPSRKKNAMLVDIRNRDRQELRLHRKMHEQLSAFSIQKQQETVLVNNATSSKPTAVSLTVRDRRHRDQSNAERIFQNIVKYCKEVTYLSFLVQDNPDMRCLEQN